MEAKPAKSLCLLSHMKKYILAYVPNWSLVKKRVVFEFENLLLSDFCHKDFQNKKATFKGFHDPSFYRKPHLWMNCS